MDKFLAAFLVLISYVILLFLIKKLGWKRKKTSGNCSNACPNCDDALNRIPRKSSDHLLEHMTFRIFDFRRYICNNCAWTGLRWEYHFKQSS